MTISKDLKEAIQKNLPQMVGNELQEVLRQGELDKSQLEAKTQAYEDLKRKYDTQSRNLDKLEELQLNKLGLDERERNLKVQIAESKAENSEKLAKQAFDMVSLIFRNAETRRTLVTSTPVSVAMPNNTGSYVNNYAGSETTVEEVK